ncbi:hypothetical protein ASZ90_018064 [hydrocarbon metagenome]|uniref:Uncharacterized protein n=1 Tax=hydrocarbon metagenome TaxID=938273 RepID=A0A0W8E7K1_9ZZZZ
MTSFRVSQTNGKAKASPVTTVSQEALPAFKPGDNTTEDPSIEPMIKAIN